MLEKLNELEAKMGKVKTSEETLEKKWKNDSTELFALKNSFAEINTFLDDQARISLIFLPISPR